MLNEIQAILGHSEGGQLITGTTAVTGKWVAIVVNEDAIFSELEIDSVDAMTDKGLTGATVTAGMYIGSGFHYVDGRRSQFTKIKLTSGSVMAY